MSDEPIEQGAVPGEVVVPADAVPGEGVAPGEGVPDAPPPMAAARSGNVVLAVLAGIATAAAGIVVWTVLCRLMGRPFPGMSVVIGLTVGYVLRVVSRRATVPIRVVAALLTAVAAVVGAITSTRGVLAKTIPEQVPGSHVGFGDLMRSFEWSQTFSVIKHQGNVTVVLYAAAVVIAFLSAGPQKPKKAAPAETADTEPAEPPTDTD